MKRNLLKGIPRELPEELIEILCSTESVRIERIISRGQKSPEGFWYDQETHEFVVLVRGKAGLLIEGQEDVLLLEEGDYINIRAHVRHRIEWTDTEEDTVWLAVHY